MEEQKQRVGNQQDLYFEGIDDSYKISSMAKTQPQGFSNEPSTEEDLIKLCHDHENLIDLILEEEEEVTNSHKEQLDNEVETVKDEMKMLYEVQKPNSDIKQYVETLHSVLEK